MKKEIIERHHIEQFLRLITKEGCLGISQMPPEPDFVIDLVGRKIGIEHTRLIRQPDNNGIDIMAHTSIANRIMEKALGLYLSSEELCLMVHVDFKCSYGLSVSDPIQLHNIDIKPLGTFIAEFVKSNLTLFSDAPNGARFHYGRFDWLTGENRFPKHIENIFVTNITRHTIHCWAANQGGMVPDIFQSNELATILAKKNLKPVNYQIKYDEIWLLIVEDSASLTSYFHFDGEVKTIPKSSFDRVYLLRRFANEFIELHQE